VLFAFDPNQARAIGLNTTVLHYTLLTLLAATAVAALQAVGACLVVAMLVTPGATAYLFTDRFSRMMGLAAAMGVSTSLDRGLWELLPERHRPAAASSCCRRSCSSSRCSSRPSTAFSPAADASGRSDAPISRQASTALAQTPEPL
jgi:hypothetical protein